MAKNPPIEKKIPVAAGELPTIFTVRSVGVGRRCRAGLCFTEKGQPVDFSALTEEQVRAIAEDSYLKVDSPGLTPATQDAE